MAGQEKRASLRNDDLQLAQTGTPPSPIGMEMGRQICGPQMVYIGIRMGHLGKHPEGRKLTPTGGLENAGG